MVSPWKLEEELAWELVPEPEALVLVRTSTQAEHCHMAEEWMEAAAAGRWVQKAANGHPARDHKENLIGGKEKDRRAVCYGNESRERVEGCLDHCPFHEESECTAA